MDKLNRCLDAGWVTGSSDPIPTDPTTRYVEGGPRVACSQLVCGICRARVKHIDGVKLDAQEPRNLGALYDSLDPKVFDGLVAVSPAHRLYFCHCHWYATPVGRAAPTLDTSNIGHWRCRGHPEAAVVLPMAKSRGRVPPVHPV